jgi:hypothetical protein
MVIVSAIVAGPFGLGLQLRTQRFIALVPKHWFGDRTRRFEVAEIMTNAKHRFKKDRLR